jgi:hypothetical protein
MSTELFTEAEMPFNLISETIAAPVKILSSREEEAARAATVRAGGYEHTQSMFDATCEGAVQIGSTHDLRAVWLRDGRNFMVIHDAKNQAYVFDVNPKEIVRRCNPPIPFICTKGGQQ